MTLRGLVRRGVAGHIRFVLAVVGSLGACDGPRLTVDAAVADSGLIDGVGDAIDAPAPPPDSGREAPPPPPLPEPPGDACQAGCHFDCFGGTVCKDGSVYTNAFAPRPCCRISDFSGDDLVCAQRTSPYRCPSGRCGSRDRRYDFCLARSPSISGPLPDHLLRLSCEEGRPHVVGDLCAADEDCRPTADAVAGRLRCDRASGRCVAEPRVTPAAYGGSCGLSQEQARALDKLGPGKTCPLCYVHLGDATCQACTVSCQLDEDCPAGSVCLCAYPRFSSGTAILQFCAPLARSSDDRRPEAVQFAPGWLSCLAPDGGSGDAR
jgi:hypothetical protein